MAVALLSPNSTLSSYIEDRHHPELDRFRNRGVKLDLAHRPTAIAFAYFHPLSAPLIEPRRPDLQPPLHTNGDVVLRFGFLEGDAIVSADRAVYDPQSWQNTPSFRDNGSSARTLALVLNELELLVMSGSSDLEEGAHMLLEREEAAILVVKRGAKGAIVVEKDKHLIHVPAYRSSRVFKIGTGDVFSAIFAHFWGEDRLSPADSADRASRAVAHYCTTRQLPLPYAQVSVDFVGGTPRGSVLLLGQADTLGRLYTREEAQFGLTELGLSVTLNANAAGIAAVLLLCDGAGKADFNQIRQWRDRGIPVVLLDEKATDSPKPETYMIATDIATALYFTAWGASRLDESS